MVAARRWLSGLVILFFAGLAAAKIYLALRYGALWAGDTVGYTAYAEQIRDGAVFTRVLGLNTQFNPPSAHRVIGYPLVVAGAQILTPEHWRTAMVLLQAVLSVVATGVLYMAVRDISGLRVLGLLAAAAYATSMTLVFDLFLLTDAFHNALVVILVCLLARGFFLGETPSAWRLAGLGALVALATLLREFQQYLFVLYLPLVVGWVWTSTGTLARRVTLVAVFALPLIVTQAAYRGWNLARSGEAFFTTGAQTAVLVTLAVISGKGHPIFDTDAPLDRVARETLSKHDFSEVARINQVLFDEHKLKAPDLSRVVVRKYIDVALRFPLALGEFAADNLKRADQFMRPGFVGLVNHYARQDPCSQRPWPQGFSGWCGYERAVLKWSSKAFHLLLLVPPVHLILHLILTKGFGRQMSWRPLSVSFGLWCVGVGYVVLYALVNMEPRYVLAVTAVLFLMAAVYARLAADAVLALRRGS